MILSECGKFSQADKLLISASTNTASTLSPVKPDDTLVNHLAETVLATTEAVDVLSERVDLLARQVQQQDCQIFALGEDLNAVRGQQQNCLARLEQLTQMLEATAQTLITNLGAAPDPNNISKPGVI